MMINLKMCMISIFTLGLIFQAKSDQSPPPKEEKLVFAHYFPFFANSIDNKVADDDVYKNNLLLASGDNNKWLANGGYIRSRPSPFGLSPNKNADWKLSNIKKEINEAILYGIDGFTFDFGPSAIANDSSLVTMLAAVDTDKSNFKIVLMPDMDQFGGADSIKSSRVYELVKKIAKDPALFCLEDGRIVLAPYHAEVLPAEWWSEMLRRWKADGINVAFVPLFVGLTDKKVKSFESISYGIADWGEREASKASFEFNKASMVHKYGKKFMQAIAPQDYRPKNFTYFEASNSSTFRNAWMSAINGSTDWVQLVTWNDYSESTQIEASTNLDNDEEDGFINLTSYYARWYKTGHPPDVKCDSLYFFFRRERTDASAPNQNRPTVLAPFAVDHPENNIELLSLLTAPGKLKIIIGEMTYETEVAAGISSFKVPLAFGHPHFSLLRENKTIIDIKTRANIVPFLIDGTLDLTYQSGHATSSPSCATSY